MTEFNFIPQNSEIIPPPETPLPSPTMDPIATTSFPDDEVRDSYLQDLSRNLKSKRSQQCLYCPYKSYNSKNVERHIKFKHTLERPFPCKICTSRFTLKESLQRHMLSHVKRPNQYNCPHCPKMFLRVRQLKLHLLTCRRQNP